MIERPNILPVRLTTRNSSEHSRLMLAWALVTRSPKCSICSVFAVP
jgi:hypothetical protein